MILDFALLYPTVLVSGVLDDQIVEKEDYREEQQKVRKLMRDRKAYQQNYGVSKEDKWHKLQNETKVAINTTIVNSKYYPLMVTKAREIVDSLENYLKKQGCNVVYKDTDSVTIDGSYDIADACRYIQSVYGNHFHLDGFNPRH